MLDGLGALTAEPVLAALTSADARLREHGVLYAEKLLRTGTAVPPVSASALVEKLAALVTDADARVRFQLAFTLPTSPALAPAFARLAARDHAEPWISAALLTAPPTALNATLLPAFTRDLATANAAAPFVAKLIEIRAAFSSPADRAELIAFIAQPGTNPLWLRALGDGLRRNGTTITAADSSGKLRTVFTRAATTAADAKAPVAARLAALALLDVAPYDTTRSALVACLAAGQPPEIQSAAIKVLAQHPLPAVTTTLIESWRNGSPAAREAVLAALIAREDRAVALLTAINAGTIKPAEIPAAQVQALTQHKTQKVAALARTALASVIPPSRAEVTATFQPALTLTGDAARGRAIYQGRCFVCHRAGDEGIALGPDLITVKSRGREALLAAILEPHKEVAPHYIAYDVTTKEGNTFTAMVARDDATGLTLKIMGGGEIVLPRAQVRGSRSDGLSLMPEGLEAGLKPGDMADLLTFIETLK